MNSGKQKRARIMARRQQRRERETIAALAAAQAGDAPHGGLPVDESRLAWAGYNSYGAPDFVMRGRYLDRPFTCRDCGRQELWSAAQQKWWYETAHGSLYTTAVRCRACRKARRERIEKSRSGSRPGPRPDRIEQMEKEKNDE